MWELAGLFWCQAGLLSMIKFLLKKPGKSPTLAKGPELTFSWDLNLLCART